MRIVDVAYAYKHKEKDGEDRSISRSKGTNMLLNETQEPNQIYNNEMGLGPIS